MKKKFDLAVIGGGPAGTSAAITAARLGFDVLLLEAGSFPRNKVCGEFVSGEALSMVDDLVGKGKFADAPRISKARVLIDHARATLTALVRIWRRPVNLLTVVEGKQKMFRYDGKEQVEKSLGN